AVHPVAGAGAAGLVLYLTTSLRMLLELTGEVVAATAGDLETARDRIRGLVGRDTDGLSPAELRSAAVESAAENLADGLVATLLPFAVLAPFSLPAAAAAAAWVKGVNTLDSMLGYPSKPLGTASARLDDLVMWLPARVSAVAIAVAAADPGALTRAREWARTPPSPNSGWPMATLACALSVRLRKPGVYDLNPDDPLPTLEDGERAVAVVFRAALVAAVLAVALGTALEALLSTAGVVV
ncbi:CobD/CbiB family cobalamin biosynthesis protein, partial [Natronococcus sp.]|uniref:CobD/CbiB family cobalamin biosynthesis protein n=1 Tax=Natronococcus sp. TaxID=35747 RepID=UPI003A4E5E14